ncbi:MAG: ABC transporter permease [Acutalibacteraceae bacterium]
MFSIIKREFKNYFSSPIGYVVMCVLLFFGGFYYAYAFSFGSADMSYVFNSLITIIFFVVPVITMRLFSEEKRLKTDQLLITSPVSIFSIVLGKFFAAFLYFCVFIVIMALYNFIFFFFGATPDMMIFLGNVIGILLFASSLIAIGIFISSLTESQVVAAVGSFSVSFFLLLLENVSGLFNNETITKICNWISFSERYYSFTEGIFDISNFVFFISITAAFIFLTVRVIDRKRWA